MQNYAKFDSRVAEESAMAMPSPSAAQNMYYEGGADYYGGYDDFGLVGSGMSDVIRGFTDLLNVVFQGIVVVAVIFYMIYLLVLAMRKGLDAVLTDLSKRGGWIRGTAKGIWQRFSGWSIWHVFKAGWANIVFRLVILVLFNGLSNILSGDSKLVKVDRIPEGYVGVDLGDDKLMQPGYHVYSPMMNSYFLSPTNTFDFEIAEATANTTEELNVTFDWRIGFQFAEGSRLGFYNQYGAKDIRAISSDIVMPLLLESIKTVIYRYSFKDLSAKSDEIKAATYELAQQKLAEKGISLQYMNIIDIRLPQSYLASQEELLKAENERKLAEAALETQKKQAEKELLKAENDKQMKIVEAEAIAEYNRIVSEQNLTAQGIEMKKLEIEAKKIEKWDGKLPASVEGGLTF